MVPCSRSSRVRSRPQRASGLAARWKTRSWPFIAAVSRSRSSASPTTSSAPARQRPGDELALAHGEVVVDRDRPAQDERVHHVAADEAGAPDDERAHGRHASTRLRSPQPVAKEPRGALPEVREDADDGHVGDAGERHEGNGRCTPSRGPGQLQRMEEVDVVVGGAVDDEERPRVVACGAAVRTEAAS